jgi:hypothetical protein
MAAAEMARIVEPSLRGAVSVVTSRRPVYLIGMWIGEFGTPVERVRVTWQTRQGMKPEEQ